MAITLKPEHERLIAKAIERGAYETPDDVITRALEVLQSEDEWLQERKQDIAAKIDRAVDQFGRGEFYSAEASRVDMDKRKTKWLRERD